MMNIKKYFFILFSIISCLLIAYKFRPNEISLFSKIYQLRTVQISEKDVKIFVINLDRSIDRYNNIRQQFDDNNLSFKKFSAVDGYNLQMINKDGEKFTGLDVKNDSSLLSLNNNYTIICPSENINYYADGKILDRTLTAGELGCYCSHREIWFKMVKENIPYALILEDDIMLNNNFYNKFLTVLNHLPLDWDLIYLFIINSENKIFYNIYNNPYLKKIGINGSFNSAAGYLLTQEAAKKLLQNSKNFTLPIDDIMEQAVVSRKVQAYVTIPFLIEAVATHNSKDSIIYEMGRPH